MHSDDAALCILLQGVFLRPKSPILQEFFGEGVRRVTFGLLNGIKGFPVGKVERKVVEEAIR